MAAVNLYESRNNGKLWGVLRKKWRRTPQEPRQYLANRKLAAVGHFFNGSMPSHSPDTIMPLMPLPKTNLFIWLKEKLRNVLEMFLVWSGKVKCVMWLLSPLRLWHACESECRSKLCISGKVRGRPKDFTQHINGKQSRKSFGKYCLGWIYF